MCHSSGSHRSIFLMRSLIFTYVVVDYCRDLCNYFLGAGHVVAGVFDENGYAIAPAVGDMQISGIVDCHQPADR